MFRLSRPIQRISFKSKRFNLFSLTSKRFIGDGTFGQPTWPLASYIIKNYTKESKKMIGWLISLLTILLIWPISIVQGFDYFDNVPDFTGSQVQLKRIGLDKFQTTVEIPQISVKLDKEDEDEGDDVPEDDV